MEDEASKLSRVQNENLENFFGYLDSRVVRRAKDDQPARKSQAIGSWWPIWEIDLLRAKEGLVSKERDSLKRALFDVLIYAREKTGKEDPTFLDLGSGDGTACFEAIIGGFKAVGVELDPAVHRQALGYQKELEDQGIITKGKADFRQGVYYLREYWDGIRSDWEKRQPEMMDRVSDLGVRDFSENPVKLRQQYDAKIAELSKGTDALEDYLDPERRLNVDVVFWYPSDSMAESSKLQWLKILKPDTIFIAFKHNSQTVEMQKQGFFDEDNYRLLREDRDFAVYQKK